MNKKQYNNIIKNTLKRVHTEDSLSAARAVFKNMGVATARRGYEDCL